MFSAINIKLSPSQDSHVDAERPLLAPAFRLGPAAIDTSYMIMKVSMYSTSRARKIELVVK